MQKFHRSNKICFLIISIVLLMSSNVALALIQESSPADASQKQKQLLQSISTLPIPFIKNEGQVADVVGFYAKTFGGTLYVTEKGEMVYSLLRISKDTTQDRATNTTADNKMDAWVLKESLVEANKISPAGTDKAKTKANYFIGSDKSKWQTNIATFNSLSLGRAYDGIELSLRAYGCNVEKIFTVHPTGNVSDIRLKIDGASSMQVNPDGELEIKTDFGPVRFSAPVAFQEIDGKRMPIEVSYAVKGKTYGFQTGAYNHNHPLIIDPLLASTFIGGAAKDMAMDIVLDDANNVYITGEASSTDYPTTPGAYDQTPGIGYDVFVSKLSTDLSTLLASTYIGGDLADNGKSIALDSSNNVYVTGYTRSTDYPTIPGASYDTTHNGGNEDVFVSKLSSDLSTLSASTYIGGDLDDTAYAIAVDGSDNVYVTGHTRSTGYPTTTGAYDEDHNGGYDVFVSKLSSDLATLSASTFVGGSSLDNGFSIALDDSGNVYGAGSTQSSNFPVTSGAYDTTHNDNSDVLVFKLPSDLAGLTAASFIGGAANEMGYAIDLDGSGNVYVTGYANSTDYPVTSGAYDETHNGGYDVVVSKLTSDLAALSASTFIGGGDNDYGQSCDLDGSGNVYVTGYTSASDYPVTSGAYDTTHNGDLRDVFVSRLTSDLATLSASTFMGGGGYDYGQSCVLDGSGNVYVTGYTLSSDYPVTAGAYDETYFANEDVFVSKLSGNLAAENTTFYVDYNQSDDLGDGLSWSTAKKTIQAALDACFGSGGGEVWVRAGTYYEGITLKSGVDLYGGFDGTETSLDQRKWETNVTTIDGTGYYHVVVGENNATIDGFTITGGNANGSEIDERNGGGMYNSGVSPMVANCTFDGNAADLRGGGMWNDTSVTVTNCTFRNNTARGAGGGICNLDGTAHVVTNSRFINNTSVTGDGGGIYSHTYVSATVTNCTFIGNSASYSRGGGLWVYFAPSSFTVTNCTFSGNVADSGGGIWNSMSYIVITNCILWGNTAISSGTNEIRTPVGSEVPTISYSDIRGCGGSGVGWDSNLGIDGGGNIDADPLFVGGYHLNVGSPCIDAADSTDAPATDIEGHTRYDDSDTVDTGTGTNGTYYDIGADEFIGAGALQRATLIDLYNSTSGDGWTNSTNWKSITPLEPDGFSQAGTECTWFGITCDVSDNVAGIQMGFNNLVGTIPSTLSNLSNLTELHLNDNQLTGSIPVALEYLSNLTSLGLDNNLLTGSIPPALGNLSNLTVLALDNNHLSGSIPTELGYLTNLQYLYLYGNQLRSSIPTQLTSLANLVAISSDFRWNAIYTSDPGLQTFLNTKQSGGDWQSTQTVAPTNLAAGFPTETSISLIWDPILYQGDFGGYEQYYSTTPGGPYTLFGTTDGKAAPGATITDLSPNTTYYFQVRTLTNSHANNQNAVYSEYTPEVSASTTGAPVTQYTLTVNTLGQGSVVLEPPGGTYDAGTVVTMEATSDLGWKWSGWSGDLSGSTNPTTITMNSDKTVTAIFVENQPPDPPVVEGPEDESTISETAPITLDAGTYYDSEGDTHVQTHWKVWRADSGEIMYEDISTTELEQLTLPEPLAPGLKYEWQVGYEDEAEKISWSDVYSFKVGTPESESLPEITAGETLLDFGMISIVHWPDDPSPEKVFNIEYDPRYYRIGTYDAVLGKYIEFDDGLLIEPGRAYWMLAREGINVNFNGIPVSRTVDIDVDLKFNSNTQNGWNMIACPNKANYYWKDVIVVHDSVEYALSDSEVGTLIDTRLWKWENGGYVSFLPGTSFLMEKYKGYWVKAKASGVSLRFPATVQASLQNDPPSMLASIKDKFIHYWKMMMPQTRPAIAEDQDSPPMPMGALEAETTENIFSGCFIEILSP